MGLTVAETFILLVFALLLLLLLLRNQAELELQEKDKEIESIQDEVRQWRDFQADEFGNLVHSIYIESKENLQNIVTSPYFAEYVKRQDEINEFLQQNQQEKAELEKNAQNWNELKADQSLFNLISEFSEFSPDERRKLSEFMTRENLEERLNISKEYGDKLQALDPETRNELGDFLDSQDFDSFVNRQDEIKRILNSRHDINQIIEQLESNTLISTKVAKNINQRLGEIVREFGGDIGPHGVISVPSDRSFSTGSAILTIEFKSFLSDFCPKLIHELHQHSAYINDIRVEGHASSEWDSSTSAQDRFLNNLDLSQRRAYAVLSYCLELLANSDLFDWATQKITAVGFSSSRPKIDENTNQEDKVKSRRVAFSYIVNYEIPTINSLE